MSQATTPIAADRDAGADRPVEAGDLATHTGVEAANATRFDDTPPRGWERSPNAGALAVRGADVDLSGMTEREREVFRSVEVHGIRPADLAEMTGSDTSTIRTLLASARDARGDR